MDKDLKFNDEKIEIKEDIPVNKSFNKFGMNLGINLTRVTEFAALKCARVLGQGDKNKADALAVNQMREMFKRLNINGQIVIGEGEIDEAPMLYIGEQIGDPNASEQVDIAVDPIDGTSALAYGMPNAISVLAVAPKGNILPGPDVYMKKLAVGPKAKGLVDINKPVAENIAAVAKALDKDISDVTVTVLKRDRHAKLVNAIRETGARISMINEGDILPAIETCMDGGTDMLMGIGGAPEGIIAAAAVKCLDGDFQAMFWPMDGKQVKRCRDKNVDLERVYYIDDLIKGDDVLFAATGVTGGSLLDGVEYKSNNMAKTQSLLLRLPSGTVRTIESLHRLDKKFEEDF